MIETHPNSYFITFEGTDYSGKSTQAKLLYNKLYDLGLKVILTKEPGNEYCESAELFKDLIFSEYFNTCDRSKFFSFLADRSDHCLQVIIPKLQDGFIVICDRFFDSTLVYQTEELRIMRQALIDNGYNHNEVSNEKFKLDLMKFSSFGLVPNTTILLDINSESIQKRMKNREETNIYDKKTINFHSETVDKYRKLSFIYPERIKLIN